MSMTATGIRRSLLRADKRKESYRKKKESLEQNHKSRAMHKPSPMAMQHIYNPMVTRTSLTELLTLSPFGNTQDGEFSKYSAEMKEFPKKEGF